VGLLMAFLSLTEARAAAFREIFMRDSARRMPP